MIRKFKLGDSTVLMKQLSDKPKDCINCLGMKLLRIIECIKVMIAVEKKLTVETRLGIFEFQKIC